MTAASAPEARAGRGRWVSALSFAILLPLAFPFRAADVSFDLGALAGWIALIPFARLVRGLAPGAAFAWASAAGTLAYTAILYWIFVVVHVHGHAAAWLAVLAVVALAAAIGLHVGLAGALAAALEPRAGRLACLVLPAAWVVAEALRTFDVFGGFPWAFLGYSVHRNAPLRALASLGGVFGLSFLLACAASLAARRRPAGALTALLLAAGAHGLGLWLDRGAENAPAPGVELALVQANIPQDQKWNPALATAAFAAHLETSRDALRAGRLDLIVWPESSVPVLLQYEPEYRQAVLGLARESGAVLVVGAMAADPAPAGSWRFFNSVFVVTPTEGYVDRYDKSHLVPFGEYVPWRGLFGFLSGVATGLASGDVTPGPGPRAIGFAELGPELALAPLVCYEVIYPGLVREAVLGGARVLLNLTNDAWYGRTSAPHQFMAIAAMRSAEHGVPMLRAANTGVSAIVDAAGRVVAETPIFERRALRGSLPAARRSAALYTRAGDWVVWASLALLVAIGGWRFVGSSGDERGPGGAR